MSEEEKLTLDIEVDYGEDDDLERLEDALRSVDDAISDTGKGQNTARIDTEADTTDAHGKLVGIKSAVEALDDEEATVDVDVNERDFDTVVSEMIEEGAHEADVSGFDASASGGEAVATGGGTSRSGEMESATQALRGLFGLEDETISQLESRGDIEQTFIAEIEDLDGNQLRRATGANDVTLTNEEKRDLFGIDDDLSQAQLESRGDIESTFITEIEDLDGNQLRRATGANDVDLSVDEMRELYGLDGIEDDQLENRGDIDTERRGSLLDQLSDQARELGQEFKTARFTMEQFHAIFASLVPLAVVFIGAMPAAITALAGLAGAALAATAAVGAIGLLGLGGMALTGSGELDIQPILERMQGIFDTFITAFTPLMNRFQPLVESAFDTLEGLANPLASAMAPLTMFESTFERLLNSIAGGLPSFTRNVIAFGQAAIPILSDVAGFFANTDFMAFFVEHLGRAEGPLRAVAAGLKEMVPFLLNVSQGFLAVVGGISLVLGFVTGLIDTIPFLSTAIGLLTAGLLTYLAASSLATVASFALNSQLAGLIGKFLLTAGSAIVSATALSATQLAIIGLVAATGIGILALGAFAAGFDKLRQRIGLATSELQKFNDVANSGPGDVGGQFGSPTGMGRGGGNAYSVNINASSPEESRRASNRVGYEMRRREQVNSVFGGN